MPAKLSLRVLVVDDDSTCRALLQSILRLLGSIDVTEAEDGQRAWEILSGGQWFDLCFLDINMPNMDGLALLSHIRRHQHLNRMRICMCSVVRDRDVIMQAAAYRPDYYIIKPFTRETIETEVRKTRLSRHEEIEPAEKVCTRLNIDPARYRQLLTSLFQDLRAALADIPDLVFRFDFPSAIISLDSPATTAKTLGAYHLEKQIRELSKLIDDTQSDLAVRRRQPASLHQWMADSSQLIIDLINNIRRELSNLERLNLEVDLILQGNQEAPLPTDGEFVVLEQEIITALGRGGVLASARTARAKGLKIPIRASLLGEDTAATEGGLTRRTSFTLSLFNDEIMEQLEVCRTTADLVRWLSYPLKAGVRWMPAAAIALLKQEIAWRNTHAASLLQLQLGGDLDAFLQRQADTIRSNLQSLGQPALADEHVAQILADIRGRLSVISDGAIATLPLTAAFTPAEMPARGEALWNLLASFIAEPAKLVRQALADQAFAASLSFHTFDLQAYLRAMDVFGDSLLTTPNPNRAAEDLCQLDALNPAMSARDRGLLLWRMIKQ